MSLIASNPCTALWRIEHIQWPLEEFVLKVIRPWSHPKESLVLGAIRPWSRSRYRGTSQKTPTPLEPP